MDSTNTIGVYGPIPDYSPDDIELALAGYGPQQLKDDLERFLKANRGFFTRNTLARVLGVSPQHLPFIGYGTHSAMTVVVLQPMSEAEAESYMYHSGKL